MGSSLIDKLVSGLAETEQRKRRQQQALIINSNWPETKWDVSGAFIYDGMLQSFSDFFMNGYALRLIDSVHGAPRCSWNGGRQHWGFETSLEQVTATLQAYEARQIAVELTFTNFNIGPPHLKSGLENRILELLCLHNPSGRNGVIMSQDALADHVGRQYPSLKRIASVTKVSQENGRGNPDYYLDLAQRYDRVMIHPDDNFNLDLLRLLTPGDKYEILVNEPCMRNCQVRNRHYQIISDMGFNAADAEIDVLMAEGMRLRMANGCEKMSNLLFGAENLRTTILSTNEQKRIYDLGFRNFKIQGRGLGSPQAMLFELIRLMLNQDPDTNYVSARLGQKLFSGK
jgi:hypothetical protein